MARGSLLRFVVHADDVPFHSQAAVLAEQGFVTGASHRNWSSYGDDVELPPEMFEWRRHLLTDPQTSGGLLIAVAHERGEPILRTIRDSGAPFARIIGHAEECAPAIKVEA